MKVHPLLTKLNCGNQGENSCITDDIQITLHVHNQYKFREILSSGYKVMAEIEKNTEKGTCIKGLFWPL